MKQYLMAGDTHGDLVFIKSVAELAKEASAEILQVGDWGYLWPDHDRLDQLSTILVNVGVTMRWCDGNHDDHVRLKALCRGRGYDHGIEIAPNVIYQPRGSTLEDEDGTRFLFCGGAPSIDRASRVEGKSWWPDEVIMQNDFVRARGVSAPVHVLVTHDAPAFPPGFSSKGTPTYQEAQRLSMKFIDKLIRHHRPDLHAHGHWHSKYSKRHETGTRIEGLDCNYASLAKATMLWSRAP